MDLREKKSQKVLKRELLLEDLAGQEDRAQEDHHKVQEELQGRLRDLQVVSTPQVNNLQDSTLQHNKLLQFVNRNRQLLSKRKALKKRPQLLRLQKNKERCLRGRKSVIGNHVYPERGIEGSNPSLSTN